MIDCPEYKGHLVLLMAPSGSGKKMLLDGLGELAKEIYFAKSYTSRARREGTEENPKYVFVSREKFEDMIEKDAFIEYANFSGNYMGTPKSELVDTLCSPQVVFKEMELQGVQQIKQLVPKENLTVIYIDAGSWEDLKERVLARAPIDAEELRLREQRYQEEVKFIPEADIIVHNRNGEGDAAIANFRDIITKILESVRS